MALQSTSQALNFSAVNTVTSTYFVSDNQNASGATYVAYLFAHNDGDGEFGPDADQDIIKCGVVSYPSSGDVEVNLGFEPQWVLLKDANHSGPPWWIIDTMRGWSAQETGGTLSSTTGGKWQALFANTSGAEVEYDYGGLTATGFKLPSNNNYGDNNTDYIYIAIRRGTAVPESATEVFDVQTYTASTGTVRSRNFAPDMLLGKSRTLGDSGVVTDRLRGFLSSNSNSSPSFFPALTNAETNQYPDEYNVNNNSFTDGGYYNNYSLVKYAWKRAPNYMDVVAYTGNSTAGRTVSHNLGVAPEMMWVKRRNSSALWAVYHKDLGNTKYIILQSTAAAGTLSTFWNDTSPTSTDFTVGTYTAVNGNADTFIAYLFATLAGISKVGSVTHSGTTNVDCGFTSGARFVLLKRTDATGDWYVWDSERGIVSGNDPYLLLNTTGAEVTNTDYIDPLSSGFTITSSFTAGDYIFYAVS